jgi:superfamily II DNA or RNA helicase
VEEISSGTLILRQHNEVHCKVDGDPSVLMELCERFTFFANNHKFNPKFRAGFWDGKIRLLNIKKRTLYKGLFKQVKQFCEENNYKLVLEGDFSGIDYTVDDAKAFIKTLNIPEKFEERQYQLDTFVHCVKNKRCLFVSPTNSGKSMMIYWLYRFYKKKTLLIVPRTGLITQMYNDFESYGYDVSNIHTISAGESKTTDKPLVISTWQSIYKMSPDWFSQFEVVIGDEAHNFKAASLTKIMESSSAIYRFGFTGSMHGSEVNILTLEGLFGGLKKIVTSRELIDMGYSSELKIKALVLKYPSKIRELNKKKRIAYEDEIEFLINLKKRNEIIREINLGLDGNIINLFLRLEHGKALVEMMKGHTNRPIYHVSGKNSMEEKEFIRQVVNKENNAILFASMGTFSEGVSIPNLNYGVLCHPSKAKDRLVQQIGRGLRKTDKKAKFTLIDIADDFSYKTKRNHTLLHFAERLKLYNLEEFIYKIYYKDI